MKKILKPLISLMAIGAFTLSINIDRDVSASEIADICEYDSVSKINPDFPTMNCLLTETALKFDMPPEVVKAIAEGESGNWRHFDENGEAIVTADNGIGIMQVTNKDKYDQNLLKKDIVYNIQAGVEILNDMFKRPDLPKINDDDRDILEHWYFAVMAYNGTKPVNSPIIQATGKRNPNAYQERIFRIIEDLGLVDLKQLHFSSQDFLYNSSSRENIVFTKMNYTISDVQLTKSKHLFEVNQKVTVNTKNIRPRPSTTNSPSKGTLRVGEIVTITGPFEYDENSLRPNHFVWYPVKTSDGTEGYIASSYLNYLTSTPEPSPTPKPIPTSTLIFKDVPANHYAKEAIYYLAEKDILKGVGQNKFGIAQGLTRWQAVLLINRAENVSLSNRPDPGFTDIPKNYPHYNAIAAAVDEGLFKGTSAKTFEPGKVLTRSEMAAVLQRIYSFPSPSHIHPFTDVKDQWFADSVARLYASGITGGITATKFEPKSTISREQFAVFLVRSIDESYRLK